MSEPGDHDRTLARLLGPDGPQLSCDECFELLDRYVELEMATESADEEIPGMRAHLIGCPACSEDHQSLLAYVAEQTPAES
ncbi:MAG: hypothetical protein ACRDK4_06665 [Solirubrobacteraceae bacterium]